MARATRDRLIDTASQLFRRQGLNGTGIKQILAGADAPFSSLYHHFPGGKDQLAAEAIAAAGTYYQQLAETAWSTAADPSASLGAVFDGAAAELVATDYADACPIATIALEVASTSEPLRLATAQVFDAWTEAAAGRLAAAGIAGPAATDLARAIIALLEGAFILSRAAKSTEPMRAARDAAIVLVSQKTGPPADAS